MLWFEAAYSFSDVTFPRLTLLTLLVYTTGIALDVTVTVDVTTVVVKKGDVIVTVTVKDPILLYECIGAMPVTALDPSPKSQLAENWSGTHSNMLARVKLTEVPTYTVPGLLPILMLLNGYVLDAR